MNNTKLTRKQALCALLLGCTRAAWSQKPNQGPGVDLGKPGDQMIAASATGGGHFDTTSVVRVDAAIDLNLYLPTVPQAANSYGIVLHYKGKERRITYDEIWEALA